ncbi:DinB family-domain-containing protein [Chytriomyces sp. MP71]|nr:DinB family-domain-containing protein [Chytriomyces sp. MP71]
MEVNGAVLVPVREKRGLTTDSKHHNILKKTETMSSAKSLIVYYARYNVWATDRLLKAVAEIPDDQYHSNTGLCFRSIHGVLNHLYVADRLWLNRLTKQPYGEAQALLDSYWHRANSEMYSTKDTATMYWEEIVKDRHKLAAGLRAQVQELVAFVEALPEEIPASFTYMRIDGPVTKDLSTTLMHVVNHGTHHRGQVSAAISMLQYPPPALDLFYYHAVLESAKTK